ncbi:hypothetical protein PMAYCL1PPCAC_29738 [Pristionchus mayeri]|uniref:Uncharacterized protein n=1 Tax=Pristionchus mayeri TaxID=1317129 RepID=A0AAN5DAK8_9BILA|nr:hypothetical protein PMAYCL1PPCAC_29738 [Pristionchus mayeri]
MIYDEETYKKLSRGGLRQEDFEPILIDLIHSSFSGYIDPLLAFDVIFNQFRLKGDFPMVRKIYPLLETMFSFDQERLNRIHGLFTRGSTSYKKLPDPRDKHPALYLCEKIVSREDAFSAYAIHRDQIALLFCPQVKKSMGIHAYGELLKSFFFGNQQIFHPQDIKSFISVLNIHYPNLTADIMVEASRHINDAHFSHHDFASVLHKIEIGFGIGNTQQLTQIFENSPQVARENREFITRIFNERYAAISEAKELGDRIEAALKKHLERPKWSKSRVLSTKKERDDLNLRSGDTRSPPLQYY